MLRLFCAHYTIADVVEQSMARCRKKQKKDKHMASFGWDVFNQVCILEPYMNTPYIIKCIGLFIQRVQQENRQASGS
jgi:hypothetical protein